MTELFSRFQSGTQITAGTMVGSVTGVSGLNAYADRLNSITTDNNLVTGSVVSGTNLWVYASGTNLALTSVASTGSFNGQISTADYEDTGGEATVVTSANNNVLVTYSCPVGYMEPPMIFAQFKVQRKIDAGAYADLTSSISVYGAAWGAGADTYTKTVTLGKTVLDIPGAGSITYKVQLYSESGVEFGKLTNQEGTIVAVVL